jgi:hypothetical protein
MNYPSLAGIVVATLLVAVPFAGFVAAVVDVVMILRYVFGYRAPGSPQWSIHSPSPTSLVVVWIVAVFTVIPYPLAIYMSWRFFLQRHDRINGESKTCPRCAEKIKAAALVCRHCGHEFETLSSAAIQASLVPGAEGVSTRRGPIAQWAAYIAVGLAVVAVLGGVGLIYLGNQVNRSTLVVPASAPCVIVADGPLGRFQAYLPGATSAQCDAELASARENFGPDSVSSRLYLSRVVPVGTPTCIVGVAQFFTSGPSASALAAQVCP